MILEARRLGCVRGRRRLFTDLSFSVTPGDCLEVRGPNGSGKTSLLRMLSGLLPPSAGAILWNGEPIGKQNDTHRSSLTYVGHRPAMKGDLTTAENLRVASAMSGCALSRPDVLTALDRFRLRPQANLSARYLSEGQVRRLALARLVACRRPLWLLDEALTALDAEGSAVAGGVIDGHLSSGGMAIIATHQDLALGVRAVRRIDLAA